MPFLKCKKEFIYFLEFLDFIHFESLSSNLILSPRCDVSTPNFLLSKMFTFFKMSFGKMSFDTIAVS